jgi:hypothetical protein
MTDSPDRKPRLRSTMGKTPSELRPEASSSLRMSENLRRSKEERDHITEISPVLPIPGTEFENISERSWALAVELLQTTLAEDGAPLFARYHDAASETTRLLASVTDGLGGSGSSPALPKSFDLGKALSLEEARLYPTQAKVAANMVQTALKETAQLLIKHLPTRVEVERNIENEFARIPELYTARRSQLYSPSILKSFPTTLSLIMAEANTSSTEILIMEVGDSPVFIFTPNFFYSSVEEGAGDARLDSLIYQNNYAVEEHRQTYPSNVPIFAVVMTDFCLKPHDEPGALNFLATALNASRSLDDLPRTLRETFSRFRLNGQLEQDDSTFSAFGINCSLDQAKEMVSKAHLKDLERRQVN